MSLHSCRECGKTVSTKALACPHCGAPPLGSSALAKSANKPLTYSFKDLIGIIFICFLVLIGLYKCKSDEQIENAKRTAEKECAKSDLQCFGNKAVVAAGIYCKEPIERKAKYSVKWMDGLLETKFSQYRWENEAAGRLTMIGDKVEFQNGFGAYSRMIYECDLDSDGHTVSDVRVSEK